MTLANPPAASGYMSAERRIGMPTEAIGVCEPMLAEHPFGAVPIATDQAWISDHNDASLCQAFCAAFCGLVETVCSHGCWPGHRVEAGPGVA